MFFRISLIEVILLTAGTELRLVSIHCSSTSLTALFLTTVRHKSK